MRKLFLTLLCQLLFTFAAFAQQPQSALAPDYPVWPLGCKARPVAVTVQRRALASS